MSVSQRINLRNPTLTLSVSTASNNAGWLYPEHKKKMKNRKNGKSLLN